MSIDIEKMFKAAAGAAEETGESNPAKYSEDGKELKEEQVVKAETPEVQGVEQRPQPKPEVEKPKPQPEVQPRPQPRPEVQQRPEPQVQPKAQPRPQPQARPKQARPQRPQAPSSQFVQSNVQLNVNTITRVLKMNSMLAKIEESERKFITDYFVENSENPLSETINNAFTVDKRDIAALDKVVVSRGHSPADRAFYLIGLPNEVVQTIFEQVDKLGKSSGESQIPQVNDTNKIEACRVLEKAISSMDDKLIGHIKKVIEFAHLADLDK